MVTLIGIKNTIKTTHNFWTALLLKVSKGKKTIRFKNSVTIKINYAEYLLLRDWFINLHEQSFTVQKADDGYLLENKYKPDFSFKTISLLAAKPFFDFLIELSMKGWTSQRVGNQYKIQKNGPTFIIEQITNNEYRIKNELLDVVGPREILYVYLLECEEGLYDYDYKDKIVLDIGGFCGETAVFFSSQKAKKVIVYEPVKEHQEYIKRNAQLNNVNIEAHDSGIGKEDGKLLVNYNSTDLSFGLSRTGRNQTTINISNITDVLLQSKADVTKIDCEGAEVSLLEVEPTILGLINTYFIETHSPSIKDAIIGKFLNSGFIMERDPIELSNGIAMLYFKKQ